MKRNVTTSLVVVLVLLFPGITFAAAFSFTTGAPDGKMASGSRPAAGGKIEIESADDFVVSTCTTSITSATFTGLIVPNGTPTIGEVVVEMYHIFPLDSNTSRTPAVPTRVNSPSDVDFDARDTATGGLTFTTTTIAPSFAAANSVLNNIVVHSGGEGPVTGQEVQFNVTFTTPFTLAPGHYFFVPQVQITGGEFYWLSAPKPTVGTPFSPDLQSWIRNANLEPDWLRIGTDVVGGATPPTFNASFSLAGATVPIVVTPTNPSPLGAVEGATLSSTTFSASGGVAPYTFSETGALPLGVTLTSGGVLSGVPAEEGSFPITVTATDSGGCSGTLAYTIDVADAPLTLTMGSFAFAPGTTFSGPVATFHDANTAAPVSDFSATINWGDGTTSAGIITSNGGGNFTVSGTHTFTTSGPFTMTVVVNDVGGSAARGTATVNGATGAPTLTPWMLALFAIAMAAIAIRRTSL